MTAVTANQHLVKQINKTLVLDTIKKNASISRADIAQMVGLNKGTVSSLVNELIEENLICETGRGQSSGGRRPVMLLFNQEAGYSIGIDLGVNYIFGIMTDLNGNIVSEINENLTVRSYDAVLGSLKAVIKRLIETTNVSPYGVVGIGIGVPGLIHNDGRILMAPNLGWQNIRLKEEIEHEFGITVIVENEANAGAYGEKLFGAGKNFENILYVSAGIGIGVGVILNGQLYTGVNGFSGEMGHTVIQVRGKDCHCGSSGCWELYASEQALLEEAAKDLPTELTGQGLTIEKLIELARNGNSDVLRLFHNIGEYLGIGINNMINSFNPEQVIIGNSLVIAKDLLENSIKKFVKRHTMEYHQKGLTISFSELNTHATAIGVSALSIESFFKNAV